MIELDLEHDYWRWGIDTYSLIASIPICAIILPLILMKYYGTFIFEKEEEIESKEDEIESKEDKIESEEDEIESEEKI